MIIDRFSDIAPKFKAIFFDSYGVLKNQNGLIQGADAVINDLYSNQKAFKILTNDASRNQDLQTQSFQSLGFSSVQSSDIITSGMMATIFLKSKIREGCVAYMGTERSANYIHQAGLTSIPVSEVNDENLSTIKAFAFLDDEGFDWSKDINKTVNILRKNNMPVIVANSDFIFPVSRKDVSLAVGSIAYIIEKIVNKRFMHFGKPDSQMFTHAYYEVCRDTFISKDEVLMVGDTLQTDIYGGNKFGLKTMLVLSGNTKEENYEVMIKSTGIIPDYVARSIVE